jgi:ferredoxin
MIRINAKLSSERRKRGFNMAEYTTDKCLYRLWRSMWRCTCIYDYDEKALPVILDDNTGTTQVPDELEEDMDNLKAPTDSIKLPKNL